jgi:hypothetical protein
MGGAGTVHHISVSGCRLVVTSPHPRHLTIKQNNQRCWGSRSGQIQISFFLIDQDLVISEVEFEMHILHSWAALLFLNMLNRNLKNLLLGSGNM